MAKYSETRRWLKSYKILKKTVKLKEKHLNDFITEMQGPLKTSMAKCAKNQTEEQKSLKLLRKIDDIYSEIIKDLNKDIKLTKLSMQEILDTINSLDNNVERCVCFCRYIMCYSWAEISTHLGYEERQCQRHEASAVKKISFSIKH